MNQSPPGNHEVALVIPIFNEGPVIGEVIRDAAKTFSTIICVDDGSSDHSAKTAREAGAIVLRHPVNLGQGAALQTGFDYIKNYTSIPYLATYDADGQHCTQDVSAMYILAKEKNLAVVFGSRFLNDKTQIPKIKRLILKTAAFFTAKSTGMKLTDAHNGLRLLRRDALDHINLSQNRMAHASQIVSQVAASNLAWAESPVEIKYTEYSKAKGQSLLNSVNIVTDLLIGKP